MDTWDLDALSVQPQRPEILRSDEGAARVIALALLAGEELQEHQVHEHAWLLVLDGEVVVGGGGEERALARGSLAHFDRAERHDVRATSDARLVLFLAPWPGPGHPSLRD